MEVVTEETYNMIEPVTETIESTTESASGMFTNISTSGVIVFLIVLSLLGVHVYYYLQYGINLVAEVFQMIAGYLGYGVKKSVEFTTEATKDAADIVNETVEVGVDSLERAINVPDVVTPQEEDIREKIARQRAVEQEKVEEEAEEYERRTRPKREGRGIGPYPDKADSPIQGRRGYCYVGKEQGYRTCVKVGVNDTCLSGEIYPTRSVCINPALRS